jgi:hypothetical protein
MQVAPDAFTISERTNGNVWLVMVIKIPAWMQSSSGRASKKAG